MTTEKPRRWKTRVDYVVECLDCDYRKQDRGARTAGLRHAKAKKHTVRVAIEYARIYEFGSRYGS